MGIRQLREDINDRILELELDERKLELFANRQRNLQHRKKLIILINRLTEEKVYLVKELSKISKT